jgi:hypothetical protein
LRAVREKKKKHIKVNPETLKARKTWGEVFQALNENNFSPWILYPAKFSFKIIGTIPCRGLFQSSMINGLP